MDVIKKDGYLRISREEKASRKKLTVVFFSDFSTAPHTCNR